MKKTISIILAVMFAISMIFIAAGCKTGTASETTVAAGTTVAETVAATTAEATTTAAAETTTGEVKKCRIWFWGEDEAKGITAWMEENAKLYHEKYPNVTWEVKHIPIDSIFTGLEAAMAAKDAPELNTVWGGLTTLQYAWADQAYAISDYVSAESINNTYEGARSGTVWKGKLWSMGFYMDPWYAMINKKIWSDSGLDPNNLPKNGEDFIAALKKVKAKGYTPYLIGMKDGYWTDFLSSTFAHEYYNDVSELRNAMVGGASFAEKPYSSWWYDVQAWRDAGLFNNDAMSLTLGEVMDVFSQGKSAYTNIVQPQAVYSGGILGDENIGVLVPPVTSTAKLNGYCAIPTNPLLIPKTCKYPEEAGKFLEFITSKERQEAMYAECGAFPISTLIDKSILKKGYDQTTYDLVTTKSCFSYQENIPAPVLEAEYAICEDLVAGKINADEAATKFEAAAVKWRNDYPKDVENYKGIGH